MELPVSFGEAFDKLTILDIKLEKIKDARRHDVQNEYNAIQSKLLPLFNSNVQYHYNILKDINLSIWEMQDIFRDSKDNDEKNRLCNQIIIDNDRRFRVKNKINNLLSSHLKEQKGYKPTKALILNHLGLGDMINCIGAVRYFSTCYDNVIVVCKNKYLENIKSFYSDDQSITFLPIENDEMISPIYGKISLSEFEQIFSDCEIKLAGIHARIYKDIHSFEILPYNFYMDYNINPEYFWKYYHIPKNNILDDEIPSHNYIITNTNSSSGNAFEIEDIERHFNINRHSTLIIDLNINCYSTDSPFYSIAEKYRGKPLIQLQNLISKGSKIILSDSSILCLSLHLDIDTDECYYVSRNKTDYSYIYTMTNKSIKFKQLKF